MSATEKYILTERAIEINKDYDVIVCGGGPAGCSAAIAAARNGAKTLILEAQYSLGGMSTLGLVPAWCPFSDKEKIIYRGIAEEIFNLAKSNVYHIDKSKLDWVEIEPESLKRIYDTLVAKAGADVLFGSFISAVDTTSDGSVKAIIVSTKAGLCAFSAKIYIDCTGDGDIAAMAGAEFVMGDEGGNLQAATHCFELGGVDSQKYLTGINMHNGNPDSPIYKILENGEYPEITESHLCQSLVKPGVVGFNAGHIWNVDATNPITVSNAMAKGRKMANAYCEALKKYYPDAFKNSFVAETAPLMGIRETRRIIGEYILTKEDYIARRSFEDEIGRNCYYLDIHMTDEEKKRSGHKSLRYEKGESHGIPYRCLTPKGIPNLLVAGRCISTDRSVYGSTRVMPVCFVTGQAAGTAAAMCALSHKSVGAIDVSALRQRLKNDGAYFL